MAIPTRQGDTQSDHRPDALRITEEAEEQSTRALARKAPALVGSGDADPAPSGLHGLQRLVGNQALSVLFTGNDSVQRLPAPVIHQLATGGLGNRHTGELLSRTAPELDSAELDGADGEHDEEPTAQRFIGELATDLFGGMLGGLFGKKKKEEEKKPQAKAPTPVKPKPRPMVKTPKVAQEEVAAEEEAEIVTEIESEPEVEGGEVEGGEVGGTGHGTSELGGETEGGETEESTPPPMGRGRSNAVTTRSPAAIRAANRHARFERNRRADSRRGARRRGAPDLSARRRPGQERRARLQDQRMWGSEKRTARRKEVRGAREAKTTAFRQWYQRRISSGEPLGAAAVEKAKFEQFWARRQNEARETSPGITDESLEGVSSLFGESE